MTMQNSRSRHREQVKAFYEKMVPGFAMENPSNQHLDAAGRSEWAPHFPGPAGGRRPHPIG
jgi:hypothetical protein